MIVQYPTAYTPTGQQLQAALQHIQSDKILRWGCRATQPNHIGITTIYNKVEQLNLFTVHGLNGPLYTTTNNVAILWLQVGRQVIGRTLRGTQGRGIQSPGKLWRERWTGARHQQPTQIRQAWLQSEWWSVLEPPITEEYRFHIVNNKSIMRMKKVQTYPDMQGPLPIRNRKNGWTFIRDCILPTDQLRETAKTAVAALQYPWGAVDLLYNPLTQAITVLEVNSAPGMDNRTATAYAAEIANMVTTTR